MDDVLTAMVVLSPILRASSESGFTLTNHHATVKFRSLIGLASAQKTPRRE
jgi:hypothetical protein